MKESQLTTYNIPLSGSSENLEMRVGFLGPTFYHNDSKIKLNGWWRTRRAIVQTSNGKSHDLVVRAGHLGNPLPSVSIDSVDVKYAEPISRELRLFSIIALISAGITVICVTYLGFLALFLYFLGHTMFRTTQNRKVGFILACSSWGLVILLAVLSVLMTIAFISKGSP